MQLKDPYLTFLENRQWDDYIDALCNDGLSWWFNMDTPLIQAHLAPLRSLAPNKFLPPRIFFLGEAAQQNIPLESIEDCYNIFMGQGDFEAACAAAGAGSASIWDSGNNYHRYGPWYERILALLDLHDRLSPLARASLYVFKAMIELTGHGDILKALASYKSMRSLAEEAGSMSLRVFYACSASYGLLWMGRFSEAEIALADADVLCERPETSLVCKIYFQITMGLFHIVSGSPEKGKEVLEEVIDFPFFELFPPPAFFLGYGHLLHALSKIGDLDQVEIVSRKIRTRAVPEQNYFHYSYIHFNLAVAYLGVGNPHKALLHCNEAMERGRLSESPIADKMPSLLYGLSLSDLGRYDEALDHLSSWISRWKESGFHLLVSAGSLDIAALYLKKGMMEKAREYFLASSEAMPEGEKRLLLYRNDDFLSDIESALNPQDQSVGLISVFQAMPVRITTFGGLVIQVGDETIYDRRWKGGRTKSLLKALVVFGGSKVSSEKLIDVLWPDTEGDNALNNLKVAVSRLRRLGCKDGETPLQWVALRHRKVSLVKTLCAVDSIMFSETLSNALNGKDLESLMRALDLYKDDFLRHDRSETWIVRHREILREHYTKGVVALARRLLEEGRQEEGLPFLHFAVSRDALNEELYIHIMRCYMRAGYPSKALQTFYQARKALKEGLDIEPGEAMLTMARDAGLTG